MVNIFSHVLPKRSVLCKLSTQLNPLLITGSPPFPPCLPVLHPVDPFACSRSCGNLDGGKRFREEGGLFPFGGGGLFCRRPPQHSTAPFSFFSPGRFPSPSINILSKPHMKTPCSAWLVLAGVLAPTCNAFVPRMALSPQQRRSTSTTMSMTSDTPPPLRSRIGHAVAVAVATSVVALGVASVPVAGAEELPAGERLLLSVRGSCHVCAVLLLLKLDSGRVDRHTLCPRAVNCIMITTDVYFTCPGTNPFTSICMGFGCGEFQGLVS